MAANKPYAPDSGSPDREQLLKMAITSAKQGNKQASRMMFQQVLSGDPRNERALMWMAQLAETRQERAEWLNRVLAVNPLNEQASEALRKMQYTTKARDNRTLLIFGVIVGVLAVLGVVALILIITRPV
jgi:thioredoxin-like negative regulator of GroEL